MTVRSVRLDEVKAGDVVREGPPPSWRSNEDHMVVAVDTVTHSAEHSSSTTIRLIGTDQRVIALGAGYHAVNVVDPEPEPEPVAEPLLVEVGGRQSGKTETLLRWYLEDPENRQIICADGNRRDALRGRAREAHQRVYAGNIITFSTARIQHGRALETAVDDADEILSRLLPPLPMIKRIAVTGESAPSRTPARNERPADEFRRALRSLDEWLAEWETNNRAYERTVAAGGRYTTALRTEQRREALLKIRREIASRLNRA